MNKVEFVKNLEEANKPIIIEELQRCERMYGETVFKLIDDIIKINSDIPNNKGFITIGKIMIEADFITTDKWNTLPSEERGDYFETIDGFIKRGLHVRDLRFSINGILSYLRNKGFFPVVENSSVINLYWNNPKEN